MTENFQDKMSKSQASAQTQPPSPMVVKCPKCQAAIQITPGSQEKIKCSWCASEYTYDDLKNIEAKPIEEVREEALNKPKYNFKPQEDFKLGTKGKIRGKEYQIIGVLCYYEEETEYDEEDGTYETEVYNWDEWIMVSEEGKFAFLSDNEGKLVFYEQIELENMPDINVLENLRENSFTKLDKDLIAIKEKGEAVIAYIEGEAPWEAKLGERVRYIEGLKGKYKYSIEYNKEEISIYKGTPFNRISFYNAFGKKKEAVQLLEKAEKIKKKIDIAKKDIIVISSFLILCFIALIMSLNSGREIFSEMALSSDIGKSGKKFNIHLENPNMPLEIKANCQLDRTWTWVSFSIISNTYGEILSFSKDFWDERGYSGGESWHESSESVSKSFLIPEKGYYTLELYSESPKQSYIYIKIYENIILARYFIVLLFVLLIIFIIRTTMLTKNKKVYNLLNGGDNI